ncbi:PD40 domain-containing protein [candidate division KSB1 bacterium]|nr:PD40 domain-containing protein [candidate division KSB1 bacterium]
MIGKTCSHYHIIKRLGAGGMGVVYQAEDLVLKRLVALKFLPPELLRSDHAKMRFIQEAQMASKLDHPNICTIYEIQEDSDGQFFIAMAYCNGQTLRERIDLEGSLPLSNALYIIIQIATGLQQAHSAGIIHRDIKPENIMITPEGLVKVMDFGLAKLKLNKYFPTQTENQPATDDKISPSVLTGIYGTSAYMSPEQIDKEPVDERTDIYSLGVIFYEMLTSHKPFQGVDDIAIMKSILYDTPPPIAHLDRNIKKALNRITAKTLAKLPPDRYQNMGEFIGDLKKLQTSLSTPPKRIIVKTFYMILFITLILSITSFGIYWNNSQKNKKFPPPNSLKMYSIGTTSEIEDFPSFSPDGKKVMFTSRIIGQPVNYSINWIKELESGKTQKLFEWGAATSWSPDGSSAVYASKYGMFVYDIETSQSTHLTNFGIVPKWSPTGQEITFYSNTAGLAGEKSAIFLYHITQKSIRQVSPQSRIKYTSPFWSPDGRWIICTAGEGSRWELWLIEATSGQAFPLTHDGLWVKNPVWCPSGQFIYYLSNQNGAFDVWRVPIDMEKMQLVEKAIQITTGLEIMNLEISSDGNKLIFSRNETKDQIWCLPLPGRSDALKPAKLVMSNLKGTENIEISPDGRQIVMETTSSGRRTLMLKSLVDNTERVLYQEQQPFSPTWSADGQWIAFDAGGGDAADIWRIPVSGGKAEKVIENPGADWSPTYSPDGNYLCYISNRSGEYNLCLRDIKTGQDTQITFSSESKSRGFWSHDSKKLAYYENCLDKMCCRILIYELTFKKIEELIYIPERRATITDKIIWKSDDSAVYYLLRAWLPLCEVSIQTKQNEIVIDFNQSELKPGGNRVFAIHHNILYFVSVNEFSDIWIAEGLRK